jgi:hypothetical protein
MPPSPAWVVSAHLPGATEADLGPQAVAAPVAPCLGRPTRGRRRGREAPPPLVRPAGLLPAREPSEGLLALAGLVFAFVFAGLVLPARPVLLRFAIALSRVGLAARRAGCRRNRCHSRTSRSGCWRVGGRWTRGQRRPTPRPRCGDRRAGLGVLCDQAESGPDEGPHQRAHDHQNLAATAKRSVHRASKIDHNPDNVANVRRGQTLGA